MFQAFLFEIQLLSGDEGLRVSHFSPGNAATEDKHEEEEKRLEKNTQTKQSPQPFQEVAGARLRTRDVHTSVEGGVHRLPRRMCNEEEREDEEQKARVQDRADCRECLGKRRGSPKGLRGLPVADDGGTKTVSRPEERAVPRRRQMGADR